MSGPPRGQPKKPDVNAVAKERNEYIPSFIANKPFYVPDTSEDSGKDYLEHQRLQKQQDDSLAKAKWYDRGKKVGPAATKFRKGACENCGAMTHKAKDCLQRKRKIGAKFSGRNIAADESVTGVSLGWDAKRDRWNGYDASEYQHVVEEYAEMEALKSKTTETGDEGGDRYEEETDMGRQQQNSTRQLRLREDTAKYLLNLDLDSAKYDPKTRSLRDAGTGNDAASILVAEEGFMKKSGEAEEFERAQRYAWEAQEKGVGEQIHLQANPTEGAFLRKKEQEELQSKKQAKQKMLLDKYGAQPSTAPLKDTIVESEQFVEYDDRGRVKGLPKAAKSQYPEDVYINNHTSVWGSWWSDFRWGYACCHSFVKNSYCTGEEGKEAFLEEARLKSGADLSVGVEEIPKQIAWQDEEMREKHVLNAPEDNRVGSRGAGEADAKLLHSAKRPLESVDGVGGELKRQRLQTGDGV